MRIKDKEIERLATMIVQALSTNKRILAKCELSRLKQEIFAIIQNNMKEEEELERQAEAMLQQYEAQIRSGQLDYHKMFQLTKAKLAKEKNFVL